MERKRETILRQKEEAKLNVKQYENKLKPLGNRKQHLKKQPIDRKIIALPV